MSRLQGGQGIPGRGRTLRRDCHASHKHGVFYALDVRADPPIGLVAPFHVRLLIIVGKSFGELGVATSVDGVQGDGLQRLSDECLHKGELLFGGKVAQDFIALAGDLHGNLIRHGGGGGTGARGVGEDVQISERQVCDEAAGGFEFGVGFAGESSHDVGSDGGGGHGSANLFDLLAIVPRSIFAVHAAEHGVTARLQGHVCVLGDARGGGHEGNQVVGPIHRLDGGDAELFESGIGEDGADEGLEVRCPAFRVRLRKAAENCT